MSGFIMFIIGTCISAAMIQLVSAKVPALEDCELLDMTYKFSESTIFWPGAKAFALKRDKFGFVTAVGSNKRYFYAAYEFSQAEHGGTHLDAPIHFAEKGITVDKISLKRLIGEACVIDVSAKSKEDHDYLISRQDIDIFEKEHGKISDSCIILFYTGWGRFWDEKTKYLGGTKHPDLHFPGVDPNATEWLIQNRVFKAVGIDTASIDRGISTLFSTHQKLCASDLPAFENVANLDRLPARGATLIGLPMAIEGGTGAPTRIVAFGWNGPNDPCKREPSSACATLKPLPSLCWIVVIVFAVDIMFLA